MFDKFLRNIPYIIFLTLIILVGTGLCLNAAHAQTDPNTIHSIDVSKLTPEQKTQLLAQTVELQKQANNPTNVSATLRNEASQWGELGANMGRATVAAAKEVGLAANDFAQTPLGKITIGIVVYKIVGTNILHIVYGFGILLTGLMFAIYFLLRKKWKNVEYENIPVFGGLYVRKVVKNYTTDDDHVVYGYVAALISAVGGIVFGTVALFNQ